MTTATVKILLPDGSQRSFVGREAWTLLHLINVGSAGVTTLDQPAPRWSHYIYKLRGAGLVISTDYEKHKGDYPGTHGRYRLETHVSILECDGLENLHIGIVGGILLLAGGGAVTDDGRGVVPLGLGRGGR